MNAQEFKERAIKTIKIPGFEQGEEIEIKVKRASITSMAAKGQIPNHLMNAAMAMTKGSKPSKLVQEGKVNFDEIGKIMELYCTACMVEPKYEEVKDDMTDEQIAAVIAFAKEGVTKLESFRAEQKDGSNNRNGEDVQEKTK